MLILFHIIQVFSEEDLTKAKCHKGCDQYVVPSWHALPYSTMMVNSTIEQRHQGATKKFEKPQVVGDVQRDFQF